MKKILLKSLLFFALSLVIGGCDKDENPTPEPPPPPPSERILTLPDITVCGKSMFGTFAAEDVAELLYAKAGLSEAQFHAAYKSVQIVKMTKDGNTDDLITTVPLTKRELDDTYNGGNGVSQAQADAYAKDAADNAIAEDVVFAMAYTVAPPTKVPYAFKLYLSPKAVGAVDMTTGSSTLSVTVKFKDPTNSKPDITEEFCVKVVIPTQEFTFNGGAWDAAGPGTLYNVTASTFDYSRDNTSGAPNYAYGAWAGWNTGRDHYSHFGTDLVSGFIYKATEYKPANLDQFIRHIRSNASVRFEFNDAKFSLYAHLAGYRVSNNRQALWSNAQPALSNAELQTYSHPGTTNDARYDRLAATVWNQFGATAAENIKTTNLPWTYNETLGNGTNVAAAQLWLSEISDSNGSTAASKVIGRKIPMQLVVEYNQYNKIPVLDFEVQFIDPLMVTSTEALAFTDGEINGSFVNVDSNTSCATWDKYIISRTALATPNPNPFNLKGGYSQQLWDYLQIRSIIYNTNAANTNLKLTGSVYVPTAGVTNGQLPVNVSLKQVKNYDASSGAYVEVADNPTHLRYFNNSGAPVSADFMIYIDAQVRYKWGVKTINQAFEVKKSY